ncbi:transcriptional adapter 2, putative [Ichthyophthirius multifiliis]|uniref:Transcriptional adapter 2, putative n=1 Tax=Ichthyophthirius multifiliis TaxID=5932 RepID=G0QL17_ICHMU|nr:transcriptional adapter 2, putative [Ichthyophthirius multifiliis]EGR34073.1 transcriptional adapter 2, putative [Ichthyophthirius multifiliis]|eukprot:XP_004039377.1 transcriptional adapter 2, putative [Ichthyophthirius multifiliis]
MDICVNCFSDGVQSGEHKITDDYNIINKLNYPLITEDWSCEEELLLFEGLERFGFGNWADLSDHIGSDKTKDEIEKHYEQYHLDQQNKQFYPKYGIKVLVQKKKLKIH